MLMCGKYLKGPFHNVTGAPGIAMPLIGAFFVKQLDDRMEWSFDSPGYHFSPKGLTAARETLKRFVSRETRFYEQGPGEPFDSSRPGLNIKGALTGP
jgi:hypothetical protein